MTKKTMQSMADEKKGDSSLKFLHTNSAVNKLASFAEEFSEDIINREEKIQSTVRLLERINDKGESKHTALSTLAHHLQISDGALDVLDKKGTILKDALLAIKYSKDLKEPLKDEIILRIQATYALRRVLNPKDTGFNHLSEYQRNIMIAALELLCQGKQALNLVGCKSARDRTAIVLSAAKTMLETPRAMQHWHVLNLGIIDSLKRGHHARAMQHHCEMIKVGDVHSDFDAQLDKATKIKNKSRKPFSKTLKEETSWKKTALKFLVAGGIATTLVLFPPLGLGLVGASLVGAISASGIGLGIAFGVPAIVSRFQNSILWQTIKQNKWKILGATLGIGIAATTFGLGFIPLGLAFLASPFLAYAGAKVAAKIEHKVSPGEDLPNEEKERILESDIGSANIPPYDEFTPPVTPSRTLRAEPEATTPSRKGSAYFEQKSTSGVSTPTSENTPQPKK
jgi:hypothetical protein